jgi:hypothetical protein
MDDEGTGLLPGTFHSEQFYPSYMLLSKIFTMPFHNTCVGKEITKEVTILL